MISADSQTPFHRKLSYSPDTEETLKLATQKLNLTAGIPHAYVIPVQVMPSENRLNILGQHTSDTSELVNAANSLTTLNPFTKFVPEGTSINTENYIQSLEAPRLSNLQTFTSHGGFFLPAGYRLIYAPVGSSQIQSTTPTAPQFENSNNDTPPAELQSCSELIVSNSSEIDQ